MVDPEEPARRLKAATGPSPHPRSRRLGRRRVGLRPEGRAPVREGAPLFADATSSLQIGSVTSGGFGPSLNAPVAMGYLPAAAASPDTRVFAEVRGQRLPLRVTATPFVPNTYKR